MLKTRRDAILDCLVNKQNQIKGIKPSTANSELVANVNKGIEKTKFKTVAKQKLQGIKKKGDKKAKLQEESRVAKKGEDACSLYQSPEPSVHKVIGSKWSRSSSKGRPSKNARMKVSPKIHWQGGI